MTKKTKDDDLYEEMHDESAQSKPGEMTPEEAKAVLARFETGGATAEERDAALAVLGEQALAAGKDVDPEDPDK